MTDGATTEEEGEERIVVRVWPPETPTLEEALLEIKRLRAAAAEAA